VVYGEGSFDEISITGKTQVSELKDGQVQTYAIEPEDFGLNRARLEDIKGGDADENAKIILSVLEGELGPRRDMVLLNAAAALMAADKAADFPAGMTLAAEAIDKGEALKRLEALVGITTG
jgi:anthranilate phosphoribosyltransferase